MSHKSSKANTKNWFTTKPSNSSEMRWNKCTFLFGFPPLLPRNIRLWVPLTYEKVGNWTVVHMKAERIPRHVKHKTTSLYIAYYFSFMVDFHWFYRTQVLPVPLAEIQWGCWWRGSNPPSTKLPIEPRIYLDWTDKKKTRTNNYPSGLLHVHSNRAYK